MLHNHYRRITARVLLVAGILVMLLSTQAQSLQVYVDRTSLAANETVNLTISVDRQVDTNAVDLSALYDDFRVFGVSPRSQTQIVNGQMSATTTWLVTLMPKEAGKLTIPSLTVAGTASKAIVLNVSDAPQSISTGAEIEVQVEADRNEAYINEQILVTIRLVAPNQSADLGGEALNLGTTPVTLLEQQQFRRVNDGVAYQVIEWQYAVFPDRAGSLVIPKQVFSVVLNTPTRQRFDPFSNQAHRVIGSSKELTIGVLPVPEDAAADWFPARDVKISSSWQNSSDVFRVGEPVTRRVVISSIGQKPAAIPPLGVTNDTDFKVYADQPQLTEDTSSLGIMGTRTESIVLVPSSEGQLELPAIIVKWWDIDQRRWKESVLPAETIIVEPADLSPLPAAAVDLSRETAAIGAVTGIGTAIMAPRWMQLITFAIALGLLLMIIQNARLRRQLGDVVGAGAPEEAPADEKSAWARLRKSLKSGDPGQARKSILDWGRVFWPGAGHVTLEFVGLQAGSDELTGHLADLDRRIYEPGDSNIPNFDRIAQLIAETRREGRKPKTAESALPGLYPATAGEAN